MINATQDSIECIESWDEIVQTARFDGKVHIDHPLDVAYLWKDKEGSYTGITLVYRPAKLISTVAMKHAVWVYIKFDTDVCTLAIQRNPFMALQAPQPRPAQVEHYWKLGDMWLLVTDGVF